MRLRSHLSIPISIILAAIFPGTAFLGSAHGDEITFPVHIPRIDGLSTTIPTPGGDVLVELKLKFDARGKLVEDDVATVDGTPVIVKGKVRPAETGLSFTITLKSTPGATDRVSVKITGNLGSNVVTCSYSGTKGKVSKIECTVVFQVESNIYARLFIDATMDCKGKIIGEGSFVSSFGNDASGVGSVKGKFNEKKGMLKLKVKNGKQKLSFKGLRDGGVFRGTAKVILPPAKVPIEVELESSLFSRPPECDEGNAPPVADAGADQLVNITETVFLDGTGSFDPEGAALAYSWTLVSSPEGSNASILDPAAAFTEFFVDLPGEYVVELVVNDGTSSSAPDTVRIFTNLPPVAAAGPDQDVLVGTTVQLDGTGSSDPNQDTLEYNWLLTSAPSGSNAVLSDPTAATPTFVPDLAGEYLIGLMVFDGQLFSDEDMVVINADQATAPGWGSAEEIGAGGSILQPRVTVDPAGNAIAVWMQSVLQRPGNTVYANRYDIESGWGTPVAIEANPVGGADGVRVASDASGNAVAVWYRRAVSDGSEDHVWANRFDVENGWGTARIIDTLPPGVAIGVVSPEVAMTPDGVAFALWKQTDEDPGMLFNIVYNVRVRRHLPGAGWADSTVVNDGVQGDTVSRNVGNYKIDVDDAGNAMVVWSQDTEANPGILTAIYANSYDPDDGWGAVPQKLVAPPVGDNATYDSRVAMMPTGEGILTWIFREGSGAETVMNTFFMRYDPEAGWDEEAARLDGVGALEYAVDLAPTGDIVAAWTTPAQTISANRLDSLTSVWGESETLSTADSLSASSPGIEADGSGNAIAVWWGTSGQQSRIFANREIPGSGWGAAGVIDAPRGETLFESNPTISVNRAGVACAVWIRTFPTGTAVWANRFEP